MKKYTIVYYDEDGPGSEIVEADSILNALLDFVGNGKTFNDVISVSFNGNVKSNDNDGKKPNVSLFS